jgi:hypothetical protein
MSDASRNRRALLAGYLAAATPFVVGVAWDMIYTYRAQKAMPGWIVDSAPPYPVQFLIPTGFYGFILFALGHAGFVIYRKLSN